MGKPFTAAGKFSKAWWLKLIKEHGAEGGINNLAVHGDTNYPKAKPAIDELFGGRYIDLMLGTRRVLPGEPLQGKQVSYTLTTLGHRYLTEHSDELVEPERVIKAPAKPVRHMVPDMEATPTRSQREAETSLCNTLIPDAEAQAPIVPSPAPDPQPTMEPFVMVGQGGHAPPQWMGGFKEVLAEILIERFADQVSAKDILERMSRQK